MRYHFYDLKTGALAQFHFLTSEPGDVEANIPDGHGVINGHYDHQCQRVELLGGTPAVVDYQPPQPSPDHEWNSKTKRWNLNAAAQGRIDRHNYATNRIQQLELKSLRAMREIQLSVDGGKQHLEALHAEIEKCRQDLIPDLILATT